MPVPCPHRRAPLRCSQPRLVRALLRVATDRVEHRALAEPRGLDDRRLPQAVHDELLLSHVVVPERVPRAALPVPDVPAADEAPGALQRSRELELYPPRKHLVVPVVEAQERPGARLDGPVAGEAGAAGGRAPAGALELEADPRRLQAALRVPRARTGEMRGKSVGREPASVISAEHLPKKTRAQSSHSRSAYSPSTIL